jgi:hypothetical protein
MILMVVETRTRCSRWGLIDQVYAAPHSCQPEIALNAWPREKLPSLVDQEEVIFIHILMHIYIYFPTPFSIVRGGLGDRLPKQLQLLYDSEIIFLGSL